MSKYIIHACPQRMDYVDNHLVPSLLKQGIEKSNISVRCDKYKLGNLSKCVEIFQSMRSDGGAWHIQDDVVICRDFKTRTEELDDGKTITCGFGWNEDANIQNVGLVNLTQMWWSFPCIYIPNNYATEFVTWFEYTAKRDSRYTLWLISKKYDDYFFLEFLKSSYPELEVMNLKPNLVDHIDYLIGGSVVTREKLDKQLRSAYFEDLDLVDELEKEFGYEGE